MSTRVSREPSDKPAEQLYRKPRADVFTMLLLLALMASVGASIALYMLMKDYEFKMKAHLDQGRPAVVSRLA